MTNARWSWSWLLVLACAGPPGPIRQQHQLELLSTVQRRLLESVEAEKSAVLAVTDAESIAFADESKAAALDVERARTQLHTLIDADGRDAERAKLAAFDQAWAQVQAIDARLLPLAVANTNLKAAALAAGEGAATVNQLVDALAAVADVISSPPVLRELSSAQVSALRLQALLAPHIASAEPETMTRLEGQMQGLAAVVEHALATARKQAPAPARARAAEAWEAWAHFQHVTAEVVRLSRLNTNVLSFDLSVHDKRRATFAAQAALGALLDEVHQQPNPTR